jgi:hypothetical protein
MADYAQGDIVRDYITAIDEDYTGLTGITWQVLDAIAPDGNTFPLDITELGDGLYRVSFLADQVGDYYWRVISENADPISEFDSVVTIGPFSLYGAATGLAATGVNLLTLIQMAASDLGDFLELTATQDGAADGSSFVDERQLSTIPPATLRGSAFLGISPASVNYGQERRIFDSSEESTLLSFKPTFPGPFLTGEVGWVTNLHSKGFWKTQYITAINNAILKANPRHLIPVSYTYPDTFASNDPLIPLPQHITHVYALTAYNGIGQIWDLPFSHEGAVYGEGWSFDQSSGSICIGGMWIPTLQGWNILIKGYGRPATLVNLEDYTSIDPAWIVPEAASRLRWSKGDARRYPEAANFESRADQFLTGTLTMTQPNTIRVR